MYINLNVTYNKVDFKILIFYNYHNRSRSPENFDRSETFSIQIYVSSVIFMNDYLRSAPVGQDRARNMK